MVYAQPKICPGEWHAQSPLGIWDTNGSPNLSKMTGLYDNQQKKRIWKIVNFAVPVDQNLKESEKKDMYRCLVRELKKVWNMKVMIIPIMIGAIDTVT